jgi:hypothetical protein
MAVELRTKYDLTIDPDLENWLKKEVSAETDDCLEQDLIESGGADDAVVVWKEKNTIADGHRRYAKCQKLGLPYPVQFRSFPNKKAVKRWMTRRQRGRRNNTPQEDAMLIARTFELMAADEGPSSAAKKLAKETGQSERNIYRANEYKAALESLAADVQAKIKSAEIKSSLASVVAFANASPEYQKAIIANIESGLHASLQAALKTDSESDNDDSRDPAADSNGSENKGSDSDGPAAGSSGFTDTLSVKPKSGKKPPAKPAADMVREAQAFLGKLDRTIDEVHEMLPDVRRHAECRNLLKQLGDRLKAWWREAE